VDEVLRIQPKVPKRFFSLKAYHRPSCPAAPLNFRYPLPSIHQAQSGAPLRQKKVVKDQISHSGNETTNQKQEELFLPSGVPTPKSSFLSTGMNYFSAEEETGVGKPQMGYLILYFAK